MSEALDREVFVAALRALGDHIQNIVLVGGWAHRLHRQLHGADSPTEALYTQDLDLAIRRPPPPASPGLDERLITAGFREQLKGEGKGVTEYVWSAGGSALSVEFLVQRIGAERAATLDVGGAQAQRLRYLDVAFAAPCTVVVAVGTGFPTAQEQIQLLVVNPGAFLANKLLTYSRRTARLDKGKDLLYMFDTLRMFSAAMGVLRDHWDKTALTPAVLKAVSRAYERLAEQQLVAEAAAEIAADAGRPVRADRLLSTCVHGLNQLISE